MIECQTSVSRVFNDSEKADLVRRTERLQGLVEKFEVKSVASCPPGMKRRVKYNDSCVVQS
jgi:hypothetical protein